MVDPAGLTIARRDGSLAHVLWTCNAEGAPPTVRGVVFELAAGTIPQDPALVALIGAYTPVAVGFRGKFSGVEWTVSATVRPCGFTGFAYSLATDNTLLQGADMSSPTASPALIVASGTVLCLGSRIRGVRADGGIVLVAGSTLRFPPGTAADYRKTAGSDSVNDFVLNGGAIQISSSGVLGGFSHLANAVHPQGLLSSVGQAAGAASRATTASATDSTLNRVPMTRVDGIFGLGGEQQPTLADLDDHTARAGLWRATDTTTNSASRPSGASAFGAVLVQKYSAASSQQWWRSAVGDGVWTRRYASSAWTPWRLLFDQATAVGTVSQTSGIPTGALLQGNASTASPAGGWFERTAAGFQTAHLTVNSSASADTTWTFTSAFLTGTTPVVTIQAVGDVDYTARLVSRSATAVVFSIRDALGARVAVPVDLVARGRWSNMT
jgi:hypothetical protein